jgi:hypothetical protein
VTLRVVLALFLSFLIQQEPVQEPVPTFTGRVSGTVTDAATGTPLKDAAVRIGAVSGEVRTKTDSAGRFALEGVPAGSFSVNTILEGYESPVPGLPIQRGPQINIRDGEHVENIQIKMSRTFALSGTVLDKDGQPYDKMVVVSPLQRVYSPDGLEELGTSGRQGRADAKGAYRITGLLPGEYYLRTGSGPGGATFYPGVRSLTEAVPIVVSTTDVGGIDFRMLSPSQKHSVRLRISGIDPMPKEFNFVLRSRGGGLVSSELGLGVTVPTPADGWFTLPDFASDSYELSIQWTETTAPVLAGRQVVKFIVADRDLDLGTITIQPPTTVTGKVTFKDGDRFRVNILLRPPTAATVRLLSSDWWLDDNDTFSISLVPEGQYIANTSALPNGHYVTSATYNGTDVLGRTFTVSGSASGRLDLVFDRPAGKVSGIVVDATRDPVGSATVVLLPSADRRAGFGDPFSRTSPLRTDQNGKFVFENVSPGEYTLLPIEAMPQYAYKNAEWLKPYEARGTRITVQKGATVETTLQVISK